jgi:hypothetical protein
MKEGWDGKYIYQEWRKDKIYKILVGNFVIILK